MLGHFENTNCSDFSEKKSVYENEANKKRSGGKDGKGSKNKKKKEQKMEIRLLKV